MTTPSMSIDPNILLGAGAILGIGSLIIFGLILLAYALSSLMIVANAIIFVKANKPSWASIIPFYNCYVFFDFTMGNGLLGLIFSFIPIAIFIFNSLIVTSILGLVSFVLFIVLNVKLAKCFGKGIWFSIGLIFLPFIFHPIIAFGDAKYEK